MSKFILLEQTYNALSVHTHGESRKLINTGHIIQITHCRESPDSKITTIKSRIFLSNSEVFDVKYSVEELKQMIDNVD